MVVVLAAMLLGEFTGGITYGVLLVLVGIGCMWEFWVLAGKAESNSAAGTGKPEATGRTAADNFGRSATKKWIGMAYIAFCMWLMWYFPKFGMGLTGVWGAPDWRIAPAFVVIVWANDICAYVAGITLGRKQKHKLWGRISPKKTWEGFVGGIVCAVAVAVVIGRFWIGTGGEDGGANMTVWALFGLVVGLAAVAGDLAESHIKRLADVKDSGSILPGHGGLLDRFDAMLGAVPAAFLFMIITLLVR